MNDKKNSSISHVDGPRQLAVLIPSCLERMLHLSLAKSVQWKPPTKNSVRFMKLDATGKKCSLLASGETKVFEILMEFTFVSCECLLLRQFRYDLFALVCVIAVQKQLSQDFLHIFILLCFLASVSMLYVRVGRYSLVTFRLFLRLL